jgi:rhodanese-related sulfurtransferase
MIASSKKIGIVDLRTSGDYNKGHVENAINIPLSDILYHRGFDSLKSLGEKVVLYSDSLTKSAEAWTFLTQMGYKNLCILDVQNQAINEKILEEDFLGDGNEVLKYKFQPDSSIRLE